MHRAAGRPVFPYPLDAIVKTLIKTAGPALLTLAMVVAALVLR
ncbi:outer membrane efflux protein [Xanthomonas oryzae pv. oryzicola BLS256]|uniref:Outer membrane efflux protein n=1 Tax=Xanthomonas oryzae pv. oryzicola (strain BLS256) TaxID=383407 RepID=G7TJQ6_XANOB|nr:outer membrane efflux protein [Xanthomonas oryzae pv. oryzicola BLS256]